MRCVCMVQAGQVPPETREELAIALRETSRNIFGPYAADFQIAWMDVAPGSGYTSGKPSTSSLTGLSVPDGTDPKTREALLSAVCAKWSEVTGCSVNEIVATAFDESAMPQTV